MNTAGRQAEDQAARYLQARGMRLCARNWRCRLGEIDLICMDGTTLVFVEVRARAGRGFGGALESIGRYKRARLIRAAQLYLAHSGHRGSCRFDVVLIEAGQLTWLRDAFDASGASV